MNEKGIVDDKGVIRKAKKVLPEELCKDLVEALAELEDNEAHRTRKFPKTRLHNVEGAKGVYRADIEKISGWRIHLMYGKDDQRIHLCDVLIDKEHDRPLKVVQKRKARYK